MLLFLIFFGRNTVDTLLTKGWAFGKGNTFKDTVDGRDPVNSPVDMVVYPVIYRGFIHPNGGE